MTKVYVKRYNYADGCMEEHPEGEFTRYVDVEEFIPTCFDCIACQENEQNPYTDCDSCGWAKQ